MEKAKVLIVHADKDDITTIIDKIRKLNAKSGPFDSIFLLGDIGDNLADIANHIELPPIFVLSDDDSQNVESEHLIILKKTGIYVLENGLSIGYITLRSKELTESNCIDKFDGPLDLLLTREWSSNIAGEHSKTIGNSVIDEVVKKCHPRYHFTYADPDSFFELEPFSWSKEHRVTRFVNVAAFGSKRKWAYAFNINSCSNEEFPKNLIENPYVANHKRKKHDRDESDEVASNAAKRTVGGMKNVLPVACHFCFTNPDIEDHLIVSIASKSYLTTAKGPLSVPKGNLEFSGHCLLIPIEHITKPNKGKEDFMELQKEMVKYQTSITRMNYENFSMSTVIFEIHSDNMVHFHKQLIPIPTYLIMKFPNSLNRQIHINNEKFSRNRKLNFDFFDSFEDERLKAIMADPTSNYMMFTVYRTSDSKPEIYLSQFDSNDRIDLQFGRRTLAFLLHLPNRTNWRSPACIQTKQQEEIEVEKFQKAYRNYDIAKVAD